MIKIIQGDITTLAVDAIVNAANQVMLGGGGVDGAIHRAAGPELYEACLKVPEVRPGVRCPTGEARITPGFKLPAKFVIHTVGPVYRDGQHGEPEKLAACYRNSLALAAENGCKSIAFPCISTGIYGYPIEDAAKIAVREVNDFLTQKRRDAEEMEVIFCCFSERDKRVYGSLVNSVIKTIEVDVCEIGKRNFSIPSYQRGYRWTEENIVALLDDLAEFSTARQKNAQLKYCLQPVVMQKLKDAERIVDGQQRLTTISLVIYGLNGCSTDKIDWDMTYEEIKNEDGSCLRLKEILPRLNNPPGKEDDINTYFLWEALETIKRWKKDHVKESNEVAKLLRSDDGSKGGVFFVQYEFADSTDNSGQKTFNEINDGKTPLTSSELLKALFIVRAKNENEKMEIAKEWELIEFQLRDPKMWSIWNTKEYDDTFTRIDMLFAIVCGVPAKKKAGDKLYVFHAVEEWLKKDGNNLTKMWEDVLRCYWWMLYCFNETEIYNFLGWLAWNTVDSATTIYEEVWRKRAGHVPSRMLPDLKKYIFDEKWKDDELHLENWRYDKDNNPKLVKILSFVNILKASGQNKRIPFEFINRKNDWSWQIEHIDSRTENEADKELPKDILDNKVKDIDAIENLALLDSKTNQGYHNKPFNEKRSVIIQVNDKLAEYQRPIMPYTLAAFTKMCSDKVAEMRIWDEETAEDTKKDMQNLLNEFEKEASRND